MPGVARPPPAPPASESASEQAAVVETRDAAEEERPTPTADALRLTAFGRWYPFHRRHAPKATVLHLADEQPDFVAWLESGSFVLPEDEDGARAPETEGGEDGALPPPSFPRLHARLHELIRKYDGAVFPKLNWSAPRDAAWIVPGATLRCTSPQDIYLLLKSSDFVATDIAQARELYLPAQPTSITVDPEAAAAVPPQADARLPLTLVIKQHYAFPTSHEFRCFVHRRRLLALSQRDTATAFPHLQPAATRRSIRRLVRAFWREHLDLAPVCTAEAERSLSGETQPLQPPTTLLRDYVFDVYLTRDMGRVFLVDLAPWGTARTDPLLWNWDELERRSARAGGAAGTEGEDEEGSTDEEEEDDDDDDDDDDEPLPPLRVLSSDPAPTDPSSSRPTAAGAAHTFSNTPTYAHNMVPADFHALASASAGPEGLGKTLEQLREEWAAAVARASVEDEDDDEGVS